MFETMERNYQTTLKDRELPGEWTFEHESTTTIRKELYQPTFASETYVGENDDGDKVIALVRGDGNLHICANQKKLHQSISYSMASARKRLVEWIEDPDNIPVATMREEDRQIAERENA